MTILIIERDPRLSACLSRSLRENGHTVTSLPADGILFPTCGCDLALVDLTDPDPQAYVALRRFTEQTGAPPVIALCSTASTDAVVKAVGSGAADFITIPVSLTDLATRMSVCAFLANGPKQRPYIAPTQSICIGDITLDYANRQLRRGLRAIDLSPKELTLLDCLVQNKGRPVARQAILEYVWGKASAPRTNVVEVFVCRLRKKLAKELQKELILTLRDGYALATNP
jgi:DNA-binding response OmpR family regulator